MIWILEVWEIYFYLYYALSSVVTGHISLREGTEVTGVGSKSIIFDVSQL